MQYGTVDFHCPVSNHTVLDQAKIAIEYAVISTVELFSTHDATLHRLEFGGISCNSDWFLEKKTLIDPDSSHLRALDFCNKEQLILKMKFDLN